MEHNFQPLLFGGDINVYSVARAFHEAYGVRSVCYGKFATGPAYGSTIIDYRVCPDNEDVATFRKNVAQVAGEFPDKTVLVIGCGDSYVKLAAENKDQFPPNCLAATVSGELINTLIHKEKFYALCDQYGIDHPDAICACVGGGSNSMGMFTAFLGDPLDIYGVEPLGKGSRLGDHSASITYGRKGVLHGFESIMLQDEDGNPGPVHSVASGLDYPSVGPEHAYLHDIGRVNYVTATDEEAVDAFFKLSRYEGIIPALESSHAIAYAMKWARENRGGAILVNCSGRGDKDVDYVVEHYGYGEDHQFPA